MLLSNLLVEHIFLKWISVRNRIASLFVLCVAPFWMWNHIYQELHFSDMEVCQICFRKNMSFQRTSAYLLFSFSWLLFSFINFSPLPSSLSCFLYSAIWCCLADISVAWKGSGVVWKMRIYWSSYARDLLRLFSSSILILLSFYTWCIFVPVHMLTYFLCSECILLKLDLNVTSISSCFRRVKFFPLMSVSGEQSCLKSALQCLYQAGFCELCLSTK